MEPTVGSTPPWAGVTPARNGKEKMRPFGPVRTYGAAGGRLFVVSFLNTVGGVEPFKGSTEFGLRVIGNLVTMGTKELVPCGCMIGAVIL